MSKESTSRQDDRVLATWAHVCIVLRLVITPLNGHDFEHWLISNRSASQE